MTASVPSPGAEINGGGRSGVPAGVESPETAQGQSAAESWAAVEALAALLEPEAFDPDQPASEEWRERAQGTALAYAAKAITSGYRRVVEDEAAVTRVENVLIDWVDGNGPPAFWTAEDAARAAVRALREGA